MRALAVFPARREFRIVDVPAPVLKNEADVMIRAGVRSASAGTDRRDRGVSLRHAARRIRIAGGYETRSARRSARGGAGAVHATSARRYRGNHGPPPCTDKHCPACRAERQDFCVTGRFRERGIQRSPRLHDRLVVEDERYLVRVPPTMRDVGVLVEPLTVVAKASIELGTIMRRFPWEPVGVQALVLGAGPSACWRR